MATKPEHPGTFFQKALGDGVAYPARGPGDNRDLSIQRIHGERRAEQGLESRVVRMPFRDGKSFTRGLLEEFRTGASLLASGMGEA